MGCVGVRWCILSHFILTYAQQSGRQTVADILDCIPLHDVHHRPHYLMKKKRRRMLQDLCITEMIYISNTAVSPELVSMTIEFRV